MRSGAFLLALLLPGTALADPRCARFGQPSYSATRTTILDQGAPLVSQVFAAGPALRIESAGPGGGRLVKLFTPELHAVFLSNAAPPVAIRMPMPPALPAGEQRVREEPQPGRMRLITERRGLSGQWHEVARVLCRRDGVLLEAWQAQPGPAGFTVLETRHSEIRTIRADPLLFRLPPAFRLIETPPAPHLRARSP